MEIITPKSEIIMHVKQMLNRKSSKFATISLFCQSLPDVFNFLGCNCRSAYCPEPLLPYLDLHQGRNHFYFFLSLPSLHLSISLVTMGAAHPVRDPSLQKSMTPEPPVLPALPGSSFNCDVWAAYVKTWITGQSTPKNGVS